MGKKGFKDLVVWQKAKDLAVQIYRLSENGALGRGFELRTQVQIACEAGHLKQVHYESLDVECETLAKMIGSLIRVRRGSIRP